MFKLVIQDDEGKTTVVPLIRDEITIGRKEGNTIRLTERNVSRRHARILRNNGEVHIEDLGSYNGIRVNNARIAERVSLRVSDQVQIGDYKLYLKAEGIEQVDDARTVPIERVDSNTATDVIPAVAPAPTQPMAIPVTPAAPAAMPAAPQLVGNPARTLVAIADTDPNGRPVASAAVVAALSAPAGHGKLVVLSSNFAGKEFELSRPQMIVGRTEDNDIVINHRSISRNHAKLVKEPETGRYTISDLQSSNGVRVNGQDYGKVELRRGDIIDLGHVRLRFIEPGEDFVFSRDATITDVPDASSKKGLLVAIVLGLIVLAGVTIFFLTRDPGGGGTKEPEKPGSGSPSTNVANPPTADAAGSAETTIDAEQIAANPTPDANEQGSATTPTVDAAPADSKFNDALAAARQHILDLKWSDAIQDIDLVSGAGDTEEGRKLRTQAVMENAAEKENFKVIDATKDAINLKAAETALNRIPKESMYRKKAVDAYNKAFLRQVQAQMNRAELAANRGDDCVEFNRVMRGIEANEPRDLANEVARKVNCKKAGSKPPVGDGSGSGSQTVKKDPDPKDQQKGECAAAKKEENRKAGEDAYGRGNYGEAQKYFEKVLACGDGSIIAKLFAAVCQQRDEARARQLYKMADLSKYSQICTRNGITFDAPK